MIRNFTQLILAFSYLIISLECTQLFCSDQRNETQKFVLTSGRNESGHWIAQINIDHGDPLREVEEGPIEIQIEHSTLSCIADTTLQIDAQITSSPPVTPSPGSDFFYYPHYGYYKRHTAKKTWKEAKAECEKEGAHLLIINSMDEAMVVLQLFGRILLDQPRNVWDREAWVGISDLKEEGNFETLFGVPLNATGYERWGPNEPNNYEDEDCLTIMKNGLYNDRDCDDIMEFVCELEY